MVNLSFNLSCIRIPTMVGVEAGITLDRVVREVFSGVVTLEQRPGGSGPCLGKEGSSPAESKYRD